MNINFEYHDVTYTVRAENGLDNLARPNVWASLWGDDEVKNSPVRWAYIMFYTSLVLRVTADKPPSWLVSALSTSEELRGGFDRFLAWLSENGTFVSLAQDALSEADKGGRYPNE